MATLYVQIGNPKMGKAAVSVMTSPTGGEHPLLLMARQLSPDKDFTNWDTEHLKHYLEAVIRYCMYNYTVHGFVTLQYDTDRKSFVGVPIEDKLLQRLFSIEAHPLMKSVDYDFNFTCLIQLRFGQYNDYALLHFLWWITRRVAPLKRFWLTYALIVMIIFITIR